MFRYLEGKLGGPPFDAGFEPGKPGSRDMEEVKAGKVYRN